MSESLVTIIAAVIGSSGFSALVSWLLGLITTRRQTNRGLQVILEDRIDYLATAFIAEGKIGIKTKARLYRMWDVYHNVLGGNGYLDEKLKLVDKLPTYDD